MSGDPTNITGWVTRSDKSCSARSLSVGVYDQRIARLHQPSRGCNAPLHPSRDGHQWLGLAGMTAGHDAIFSNQILKPWHHGPVAPWERADRVDFISILNHGCIAIAISAYRPFWTRSPCSPTMCASPLFRAAGGTQCLTRQAPPISQLNCGPGHELGLTRVPYWVLQDANVHAAQRIVATPLLSCGRRDHATWP